MGPRRDEDEVPDDKTQDQVGRLLAAAGQPDQRVPEDVAERLDAALAALVAERGGGRLPDQAQPEEASPVSAGEVVEATELSTRRRPWGPRLLVAAAAVSVIALGVGVSVDGLIGSGRDAAVTSETAGRAVSPERAPGGAADESGSGPLLESDGLGPPADSLATPVRLRTGSLRADVQRVVDAPAPASDTGELRPGEGACVRPVLRRGDQWLSARLDGRPAVLVLRAPEADRRTAEVFACGSPGSPVASTTVDAG